MLANLNQSLLSENFVEVAKNKERPQQLFVLVSWASHDTPVSLIFFNILVTCMRELQLSEMMCTLPYRRAYLMLLKVWSLGCRPQNHPGAGKTARSQALSQTGTSKSLETSPEAGVSTLCFAKLSEL